MTFAKNATYEYCHVGDSNCRQRVTVLTRTPKTVLFADKHGKETRTKIFLTNSGEEFFYPKGRYSMAPIVRAGELVRPALTLVHSNKVGSNLT